MAVETGEPSPPAPFLPEPERTPWPKLARPQPQPQPGPRRNWLWFASLAVTIVVALGAIGLLYQDDRSWQRQAADLARQNASLHEQLVTTQSDVKTADQTIRDLKSQALHPNLGIWNLPQPIADQDHLLLGNVPDTFTYHLHATASGPMSVSILTVEEYAVALDCVHNGLGVTNDCMHRTPTVISWLNVRSVDYDFHLGEGCADYIVVFTAASSVTVTPNVSVTYNPAPTTTGACAA